VTHQVVEHVVHRDALDMDLALLRGESLQRRRNQHQNRHIFSFCHDCILASTAVDTHLLGRGLPAVRWQCNCPKLLQ